MRELLVEQFRQSIQRYIRYERRADCPLGCALRRAEEPSMLEIACLQPRLDQPPSWEIPESAENVSVADVVERTSAIGVENPSCCRTTLEPVETSSDSVMDAASGTEAVAGSFEVRFPGWLQRRFDHMLANSVLNGCDAQCPKFSAGFRDVDATHRLWPMRACLAQVGEQPPTLLGGGGYPPIHARRRTPIVDLRHFTDGEDQVGITPGGATFVGHKPAASAPVATRERSAAGAVAPRDWRRTSRCRPSRRLHGSGPWSRSTRRLPACPELSLRFLLLHFHDS